MAEIVLKNIVKRFGELIAVNNVNLTINDKEFVVLLGPSGCGKTTTLRCISGLETPDEGKIFIDGVDVTMKRASQRDIAFVFQLYALYPHLTAYANIAFPLKAQKYKRKRIEEEVKRVSEILKINHILNKKPKELSGGDMQRIALGRAMVRRPKAFLLDEPIGTLDAKFREEMRIELKKLHVDIGATTVYVTHDQGEAMEMGDKIAVMHLGVIQQYGTPFEIYHKPRNLFVANFIGSPAMNFLSCKAVKNSNGELILKLSYKDKFLKVSDEIKRIITGNNKKDKDLVLGVRPEDIIISPKKEENYIDSSVFIVETIGTYNIVDIKFGEEIVRVRTQPSFLPNVGDPVFIYFDMKMIRLFDKETGNSIM